MLGLTPGTLVRILPAYIMGQGRVGMDAYTGRVLKVFGFVALTGDYKLGGPRDEEESVWIHEGRCEEVRP